MVGGLAHPGLDFLMSAIIQYHAGAVRRLKRLTLVEILTVYVLIEVTLALIRAGFRAIGIPV